MAGVTDPPPRLLVPLRSGLDALLGALGAADGDVRYVGGAVRDALVGQPFSDVDLATRLSPTDVMDRLKRAAIRAVPTGFAHGTVTAVLPGGPIEVTTLRRDVATDGRHATVAFSGDWREDAARRDFTINALYADPLSGELADFFDGRGDLCAGRVRFIGEAERRIAEDHLRILRFFRFYARYGRGEPDAEGLAACVQRANDLMALSRERIADELIKLLGGSDPAPTVRLMHGCGILAPVMPEIDPAGLDRLAVVVAAEARTGMAGDPVRRLAALLPPDSGAAVARRLRMSNANAQRIAAASAPPGADLRATAYRDGREAVVDRLLLAGEPLGPLAGWHPPRLPIGGGALVARGLTAGPAVARTLRRVEAAWIAEGFPPEPRVEEIADRAVAQALAEDSSA